MKKNKTKQEEKLCVKKKGKQKEKKCKIGKSIIEIRRDDERRLQSTME